MTEPNEPNGDTVERVVADQGGEYDVTFNAVTDDRIRAIAREEIASMAGLVLRRTGGGDTADDDTARRLASIFGEILNDFTTDTEPGE